MRLSFLVLAFSLLSVNAFAEISTVPYVDLNRYLGRWYQLASNPMPFDADCVCSQQTLTARNDGQVGVYNSCNRGSVGGTFSDIVGVAQVQDKETNAKLTVDFGLPFKGQYWVIALDPNYQWAIVSEGTGRSLFILSRVPETTEAELQALIGEAAQKVDVSKLKITLQKGCTYPPL